MSRNKTRLFGSYVTTMADGERSIIVRTDDEELDACYDLIEQQDAKLAAIRAHLRTVIADYRGWIEYVGMDVPDSITEAEEQLGAAPRTERNPE